MSNSDENRANNAIAEIKGRLDEQTSRMSHIESSIKVLNDAHVKNETDHTEIKLALSGLKIQISTTVKIVTFAVSAVGVLIVVIQFCIEHWR